MRSRRTGLSRGSRLWAALAVAAATLLVAAEALLIAAPVRAADSPETPCAACRLWDTAMAGVPVDAVTFEALEIPDGVLLRATSLDPQVQTTLWNACTQRQHLLEMLQRREAVPLCAPCQANLDAFASLRIDALRLPDGVLLLYTSTDPEVVHRLQSMVSAAKLTL
jgi:hypothetical protein